MIAFRIYVLDHLVFIVRHTPGSIIVGIAMPDVKYLPHRVRYVAIIHKVLRQRNRIRIHFPKLSTKAVKASRWRTTPQHQIVPGSHTDRLIAISTLETHPFRGQPIYLRCDGNWITISPDRRFQIVDQNQQYIGPISSAKQSTNKTKKKKRQFIFNPNTASI